MKASLYAVLLNKQWRWQLSVDMSVDYSYWFDHAGATTVLQFEPPCSYGQAVCWQEVLASDSSSLTSLLSLLSKPSKPSPASRSNVLSKPSPSNPSSPSNIPGSSSRSSMLRAEPGAMLSTELGTMGVRKGTEPAAVDVRKIQQILRKYGHKLRINDSWVEQMNAVVVDAPAWFRRRQQSEPLKLQQHVLNKLVSHLQGRALLWEELPGLLEFIGLILVDDQLRRYIQMAYLKGYIKLENGISLQSKHRFLGLGMQPEYRCRRCGSGADRLYWSDCASCGERCPYCEECLTMGRTRFCSVLILGENVETDARNVRDLRNVRDERDMRDKSNGWNERNERNERNEKNERNERNVLDGRYERNEKGHAQEVAASFETARLTSGSGVGIGSGARAGARTKTHPAYDLQHWGLSPAQLEASLAGIRYLEQVETYGLMREHKGRDVDEGKSSRPKLNPNPRPNPKPRSSPPVFLLWAVTGAGKTEMMYPLIEAELLRGGKVLIATPRRDVVLELKPRVQKAFPQQRLVTLYGGSEQRWYEGDITLATTHQLLRFWQKYDLVIIDEIDAFPFHNNPMLQYAALKARKPTGKYILLSATPPADMQRAAASGKLPHVKVPARFHRHPLPVPKLIKMNRSQGHGTSSRPRALPLQLMKALQYSLDRGAQLFVFVAKIKDIPQLISHFQQLFPQVVIDGTSSQDAERQEKVQAFRQGQIRILITTTILERGVTVPKTDVFVLASDSPLFDEAALVQMAGRSGRSSSDPDGYVYFCAQEKTNSQVRAIRQIKRMNLLARKKGYID